MTDPRIKFYGAQARATLSSIYFQHGPEIGYAAARRIVLDLMDVVADQHDPADAFNILTRVEDRLLARGDFPEHVALMDRDMARALGWKLRDDAEPSPIDQPEPAGADEPESEDFAAVVAEAFVDDRKKADAADQRFALMVLIGALAYLIGAQRDTIMLGLQFLGCLIGGCHAG